MYKIGIIGHNPEDFIDQDNATRSIDRVIELLFHQYGRMNQSLDNDGIFYNHNTSLVLNILGNVGAGIWAGKACKKHGVKYHLFLPFPHETTSQFWYESQKAELNDLFLSSYETSTQSFDQDEGSAFDSANAALVDNSNFVVAFWEHKRIGKTFDAIKYALSTSKLVLDGMNDLKLITNSDLQKRLENGRDK